MMIFNRKFVWYILPPFPLPSIAHIYLYIPLLLLLLLLLVLLLLLILKAVFSIPDLFGFATPSLLALHCS